MQQSKSANFFFSFRIFDLSIEAMQGIICQILCINPFWRAKYVRVTWTCIYNKAMIFYKSAINDPSELKKPITIFSLERRELILELWEMSFSLKTFRRVCEDWFEGQNEWLVPKIEWGFEEKHKIAGAMIVHSVLPGFSCIHPAIYARVTGKSYKIEFEDLPNVEDIPKHAGNVDLLEFVNKITYRNC